MQAKRILNTGLIILTVLSAISPAQAVSARQEITFIQLNDLHANLIPHADLVRVVAEDGSATSQIQSRGGIARIATLVKQLRAGHRNTVLMNIGDTYHGGVEALYTRGNAIIAPVDQLNIDVGVPGNWDFAYGPITTRLRYGAGDSTLASFVNDIIFKTAVEKPHYPIIAANVNKSLGIFFEDEPLLPATHILERSGIKIGFIGITSDIVERMSPMLAWGFTFLEGEAAYRDLINEQAQNLRSQGVQLVVVMSELGLHRDHQLANTIHPGVDIFFSAHTHELTPEPLSSSSGALVVEAGNDAFLGQMTVSFSEGQATQFDWSILAVDDSITPDPAMAKLVAEARAPFLQENVHFDYPLPGIELPLTEAIDTIVGRASGDLHRRNVLENPFNNLLADSMRDYYKSDIALTPGFRFDSVVPAGTEITLEQLYRYLPVPPQLASGTITGANLKAVFETELMRVFSRDAFKHSGGWLMGISGIDLSLDLNREEGHRVIAMARSGDGSTIGPTDVLQVVSCSRPFDDNDVMCSNPGFRSVSQLSGPDGKAWTPMQLLRQLMATGPVSVRQHHFIHDEARLETWPTSPYIQPLHSAVD